MLLLLLLQPEARPIKSSHVKGTRWSEVILSDDRVYYFNEDTKETSWAVPREVQFAK